MSYLKFLNLVDAVRQLPSYPAMDSTEVRLLNSLAVVWHEGKKISVLEAMNMLADVSPSSVRRLKTLRAKGFIKLQEDEFDNRIKYIVATPLAHKYFNKMNECLVKALA
jgi:DNA-binding MarR family transcriptional regulator